MTHRLTLSLLALLLIFCFVTNGFCGSLVVDEQGQLSFAKSLESTGAYGDAAREYGRFAHFFPDSPNTEAALYAQAMAWYHGGSFDQAEKAFAAFGERYSRTSLGLSASLMAAQCRNRKGDPASGAILLTNLSRVKRDDPDAMALIQKRLAWTRLEMGDLPRAESLFQSLVSSTDSGCGYNAMLQSLDRFKALPQKSPALAGTLSIVPGGGYLYLGRYQDAFVALLLNAALGLAAADSFDDGNNALGALISFVGFGFYSGNIHGAYNGAKKANRSARESLWRDMLLWGAELEKRGNETCLGLTLTVPFY